MEEIVDSSWVDIIDAGAHSCPAKPTDLHNTGSRTYGSGSKELFHRSLAHNEVEKRFHKRQFKIIVTMLLPKVAHREREEKNQGEERGE